MPGDTAPAPLTGPCRAVTVFEKGLSNMADMLSRERPHEPPQQSAHLTRFTVVDVMRMAGAGVLRDDRRYELINGLIYEIHAPGPNTSTSSTKSLSSSHGSSSNAALIRSSL